MRWRGDSLELEGNETEKLTLSQFQRRMAGCMTVNAWDSTDHRPSSPHRQASPARPQRWYFHIFPSNFHPKHLLPDCLGSAQGMCSCVVKLSNM